MTKISQWIKKNLVSIIGWTVILFVLIGFIRTCDSRKLFNRYNDEVIDTVVRWDTVILSRSDTFYSKPELIRDTIIDSIIFTKYLPSQDHSELLTQYNNLVKDYVSTRIYQDTLRLDSFNNIKGWIATTDTVRENFLIGRSQKFNLTETQITKTVTITKTIFDERRKLYIGIKTGAWTSPTEGFKFNTASLGIKYKDKKDNIFTLDGGYIFELNKPNIELGYYKKLSFRK